MSQPARFEILKSGRYFTIEYFNVPAPHISWSLNRFDDPFPYFQEIAVGDQEWADNVHARVIQGNEREVKDDGYGMCK